MLIVGVGGVPASGKTSLMRKAMQRLDGTWREFQFGECRGHHNRQHRVFVLGRYSPRVQFAGTDKLSMSAARNCLEFCKRIALSDDHTQSTILFEGDRLFSASFINQLLEMPAVDVELFVLAVEPEVLAERREGRVQNESWVAGRHTKVANISEQYSRFVTALPHNTEEDMNAAVERLLLSVGSEKRVSRVAVQYFSVGDYE